MFANASYKMNCIILLILFEFTGSVPTQSEDILLVSNSSITMDHHCVCLCHM